MIPSPPSQFLHLHFKTIKNFLCSRYCHRRKRRNFLEHCFENKHIFEAIKDALYFCYLNKIKRCLVSFWKKTKIFVSDDALLDKLIKLTNKICKMVQCADGWELKAFYHSLKDCFEKVYVSLDEKRTFFMGQYICYSNFFEFFAKELI